MNILRYKLYSSTDDDAELLLEFYVEKEEYAEKIAEALKGFHDYQHKVHVISRRDLTNLTNMFEL